MKRISSGMIGLGVILLVIVIAGIGTVGTYNGLASAETRVDKAWSDVETSYQRRSDLIPNLVAVAEQASVREGDILEGVINARANAVNATDSNSSPAQVDEAQGELNGALNRLMVVSEDYPELQSNDNWVDLQAQIEGTENRINVARRDYNDVAQSYNDKIVRFPSNMIAGMFGFEQADYFKSDSGAEKAPAIDFSNSSDGAEG